MSTAAAPASTDRTPAKPEPAPVLEYVNCGSGIDYGICRRCGRGHGHVVWRRPADHVTSVTRRRFNTIH